MSIATIRDGLKTRAAEITGLTAYDTVPDQAKFPCLVVRPASRPPRHTLGSGGPRSTIFELELYVSHSGGFKRAQDAIDGYLDESGATSIEAKIEADKTLSGAATTLSYNGWRDYGEGVVGGITYLSVVFEIEVWS